MKRAPTHGSRLKAREGRDVRGHAAYSRWRKRQPDRAAGVAFYASAVWKALRRGHAKREPLCRECKRLGHVTPLDVVDHIEPIRQRPDLMADSANLQSLCHTHHRMKTARETRGW